MNSGIVVTGEDILARLEAFIQAGAKNHVGPNPVKPGHRVVFHWPPHAVSHDYHVDAASFHEKHEVQYRGETLHCTLARTPFGIFGRVEDRWNEARGESVDDVLRELTKGVAPWFDRMDAITQTLDRETRYHGHLDDLPPQDLIVLLYCPDRDVAHHAMVEIEKHASTGLFTPALLRILRDDRHPHRRSAQWCALDMLEDISAFCPAPDDQLPIIDAVKDLIITAQEDYARTVFKAGVVLGGHISTDPAADALLACLDAPHRVGRRSAVHACFHLAEWLPSRAPELVRKLRTRAQIEPDPQLRDFAAWIADDIESGAEEHVTEPTFPDESP